MLLISDELNMKYKSGTIRPWILVLSPPLCSALIPLYKRNIYLRLLQIFPISNNKKVKAHKSFLQMAKSTIYSFSNAHSVKFIVKLQMNICSKKIKINLPRYRDNCRIFFFFFCFHTFQIFTLALRFELAKSQASNCKVIQTWSQRHHYI